VNRPRNRAVTRGHHGGNRTSLRSAATPIEEEGTAITTLASDHRAPATVLGFDHVSMVYADGTAALDDVTFAVAPGQIVSVVGPSGCGKSTLLRIASGLSACTGGQVAVDTERLGYVFQDATLLPWRTVLGNVSLLLELHGVDKEQRTEAAVRAIDAVGLRGFEHHHPKRLSGGMRMRTSLARSLTLEPRVFLFDEPFGALDEITRERLNDEVLRLFVEKGFAGLFVTHSVFEACFMATRVLVMSARPGRVVADITVPFGYPRSQDLRFDPQMADVAGRVSQALREQS
jgi:NitT/TauT family transport system ATP-binding protein